MHAPSNVFPTTLRGKRRLGICRLGLDLPVLTLARGPGLNACGDQFPLLAARLYVLVRLPDSTRNDGRFFGTTRGFFLEFWGFTSEAPVMSEAGFDPEAFVL
jgi:hypothetical protein